jgi:hypothetical protein
MISRSTSSLSGSLSSPESGAWREYALSLLAHYAPLSDALDGNFQILRCSVRGIGFPCGHSQTEVSNGIPILTKRWKAGELAREAIHVPKGGLFSSL